MNQTQADQSVQPPPAQPSGPPPLGASQPPPTPEPQPPSHALPEELSKSDFFGPIRSAVRSLVGTEIARFEWTAEQLRGGMAISIGEFRGKVADVPLVLRGLGPKPGRPVETAVSMGPGLSKTRAWYINFRFPTPNTGKPSTMSWSVATVDEVQWDEDDHSSGEFPAQGTLMTRGGADLEALGAVWFPPIWSPAAPAYGSPGELRTRVLAVRHPAHERLRPYWPQFDPDESTWLIPLPETRFANGKLMEPVDLEGWTNCMLAALCWATVVHIFKGGKTLPQAWRVDRGTTPWLPSPRAYEPRRAVNLLPARVFEHLAGGGSPHEGAAPGSDAEETAKRRGLRMPWHVIESACAALNSGKHVIFTGPPGCGKTKLAVTLAKLATGNAPVVATASAGWTSGDLIGRYMPSPTGHGLDFKPGMFLRTVERSHRWLLLDEFNRANIDACFGELFSVLAGDIAELPFEEAVEASEGMTAFRPVRIVPAEKAQDVRQEDVYRDYSVSESFRILGTMNDADRSQLHDLSFALQRRFNIIRVEAPEPDVVRSLIRDEADQWARRLGIEPGKNGKGPVWRIKTGARKWRQYASLKTLEDELFDLFGRGDSYWEQRATARGSREADGFEDLVRERVVGIATVVDIIRFVAEGLRAENEDATVNCEFEDADSKVIAEELALSYLALAIVLMVFPQLEALRVEPERFRNAVRHILWVFGPRRMWQIEKRPGQSDFTLVPQGDIPSFLLRELNLQCRGSGLLDEIGHSGQGAAPDHHKPVMYDADGTD